MGDIEQERAEAIERLCPNPPIKIIYAMDIAQPRKEIPAEMEAEIKAIGLSAYAAGFLKGQSLYD